MSNTIDELLSLLEKYNGINSKSKLSEIVKTELHLIKDSTVYYNQNFAIRFSSSANKNCSNTVISLSRLQKYDQKPFIVCIVTPSKNYVLIANTTFLKKISHTSQKLRIDNIRGSFNVSDIHKTYLGVENNQENFEYLFNIHNNISFENNLMRLVEATNNIVPSGEKYSLTPQQKKIVLKAPKRAEAFCQSDEFLTLKADLDKRVKNFSNEIMLAAFIENVNVRGRIIEYLIAGDDEKLRKNIASSLHNKSQNIPKFSTKNDLGDYYRKFENFETTTDIKTKILTLGSNPKAYNIDKILEFLGSEKTIFMFYFVGINPENNISTAMISIFQNQLLDSTITIKHWAGRNSRGVTQFEGNTINKLIQQPNNDIDIKKSIDFLKQLISI